MRHSKSADEWSYEILKAGALSSGADISISRVDERGDVVASFWQKTTEDPGGEAYRRALHPPADQSMERYEPRRPAVRSNQLKQSKQSRPPPRLKPSPQAQRRSRPSFGMTGISESKRPDGTPWW